MAKMCCRVRGNADPMDRPRVYFTCHPEDRELYFEQILGDLFAAHDCAVYYTENMNEQILEDEQEFDLGRNHLFVVPVTFKMLQTPNRAMDKDIPYALGRHIPVLPILMEPRLYALYALPDKFGELQYLERSGSDPTKISYAEKLKKYLDETLHSREDLEEIRGAFSARIFLSYRKDDRKHANELLRMIHRHEQLRDVAVWFDEFLPLGESFRDSIDTTLARSDAFLLLVTQKLLEPGNYVMEVEYPAARRAGIPIIPVIAEPTDKAALRRKYEGLPTCLMAKDEALICARIISLLPESDESDNPEALARRVNRDYLIGLAYLDGIDVEVERERGMEMITSAAKKFNPWAMEKLYTMYRSGLGVRTNYQEALKWAKASVFLFERELGEEDLITCAAKSNLAVSYGDLGEHRMALELKERVYESYCRLLGEEDPTTIGALSNIAIAYNELGEYRKSLELKKKVYAIRCRLLGEDHPETLDVLNNLAVTHSDLGEYRTALEMHQTVYDQRRRIFGEDHPDTITSLSNMASVRGKLGEYRAALEMNQTVYELRRRIFGEEHPDTISSMNNLASSLDDLGDYRGALGLYAEVFKQRRKIYEDIHPETISAMMNLAVAFGNNSEFKKAWEINKNLYDIRCQLLGEEHPDTISSLNNLAESYHDLGDYRKSMATRRKAYELRCKVLGEEHPETLTTLNALATAHLHLRDKQQAIKIREKAYDLICRTMGEKHPDSLRVLGDLAATYGEFGEYQKALPFQEKACALYREVLGEEHPDTMGALNNLSLTLYYLGEYQKALEYKEKEYALQCKILGEENQTTIMSLNNMALIYSEMGDQEKAFRCARKVYALQCHITDEKHPMARKMKVNMDIMERRFLRQEAEKRVEETAVRQSCRELQQQAQAYRDVGRADKELEARQKLYDLLCRDLGEENVRTLAALHELAAAHREYGEYETALMLAEKEYALRLRLQGEDYADTRNAEKLVHILQKKLGVGRRKTDLFGAFRSLFRKSDKNQN